jgi:hypothetical protein
MTTEIKKILKWRAEYGSNVDLVNDIERIIDKTTDNSNPLYLRLVLLKEKQREKAA